MPSARASIKWLGVVAPIALSCVMHRSLAAGSGAEVERRDQELQRLSISARSQTMTFARAIWLREHGSPRAGACLWRLWESDWTAIRRTAVASLPAWCRDVTADVTAAESRDYAITFLHGHSIPDSLRTEDASDALPPARLDVAMQRASSPSTPLMASPAQAIQRSLDDMPRIVAATGATSRLSQAGMFEDDSDQVVSGIISGIGSGLFE